MCCLVVPFEDAKKSTTDQITPNRSTLFDNYQQTRHDDRQDADPRPHPRPPPSRRHPEEIAATLRVSQQTVFNVKRRYLSDGLDAALFDQPRSGRPIEISGTQRAKITALACSTPPEGHARWTLRLLADKAVELEYCEHVSHNAVKEILKKTR